MSKYSRCILEISNETIAERKMAKQKEANELDLQARSGDVGLDSHGYYNVSDKDCDVIIGTLSSSASAVKRPKKKKQKASRGSVRHRPSAPQTSGTWHSTYNVVDFDSPYGFSGTGSEPSLKRKGQYSGLPKVEKSEQRKKEELAQALLEDFLI